ncbi:hypothetical protein ABZ634_17685, partial [Nocardiopsis alba]
TEHPPRAQDHHGFGERHQDHVHPDQEHGDEGPRVVSSAAARCAESLLPYTVGFDAPMVTERALTVGRGGRGYDVDEARRVFTEIITERRPTVVCTHGELVPALMAEALTRAGAPLSQQLGLRKGSFWVLHMSVDGGLAGVERHDVRE